MKLNNLKLWKAKLKASEAEQRQWAKVYNRADRALLRVGKQINELEKKIANELAKAQ